MSYFNSAGKINQLSASLASKATQTNILEITNKKYLNMWFANGIKGKKLVIVGDSTTDYAYGLHRSLSFYQRRGGELEGTAILNYGYNGQTLANWNTDSGRYGKASTIAQQADLYIFCYGINDCRQSALTEDQFTSLLTQSITDLQNGSPNSTILLRVPNTFTTSDTGTYGFISPETPATAQAISTLLRNAYIRVANSMGIALLDTQSLVYGLTSQADVQSPYMLNQLHPNDLGNHAVAREIVKMIGVPATIPPVVFSMSGKVGAGTLGRKILSNGGTFRLGYIDYKPTMNSGSLTIEFRKVATNGTTTVIGTATYSGGTDSSNVMTPQAVLLDKTTLAAGEGLEVAVTSCTVETYNLSIFTALDETPRVSIYPLMLRGSGLVSSLDSSVVYPASQGLPITSERDIRGLKAIRFKPLKTNRFINWSQDASQSSVWTILNATVSGTPGNQTITATTTSSIAALNAPATAGETLNFAWQATNTGTPQYAVYDLTNGVFIVSPTNWPAADGNGWRSVTFAVPTGCTMVRCYPLAHSAAVGDTITLTGMQLTSGSTMGTYCPTNAIGTSMVVNSGALPSNFTKIQFVKVDAYNGVGVVSTGVNTDGNPALQAENQGNFGYPVISTRGTVTRGSAGTWQSAILRATNGNVYVTLNDQPTSVPFTKAVNLTSLRWNLLNDGDTTGTYQTWDGEVIAFYFPYLLTEGEAMAFVRQTIRTLQAAGENITGDWIANKLA